MRHAPSLIGAILTTGLVAALILAGGFIPPVRATDSETRRASLLGPATLNNTSSSPTGCGTGCSLRTAQSNSSGFSPILASNVSCLSSAHCPSDLSQGSAALAGSSPGGARSDGVARPASWYSFNNGDTSYQVGGLYSGSTFSATSIYTTIGLPSSSPRWNDQYYELLSTFDNGNNYDQIGLASDYCSNSALHTSKCQSTPALPPFTVLHPRPAPYATSGITQSFPLPRACSILT